MVKVLYYRNEIRYSKKPLTLSKEKVNEPKHLDIVVAGNCGELRGYKPSGRIPDQGASTVKSHFSCSVDSIIWNWRKDPNVIPAKPRNYGKQ